MSISFRDHEGFQRAALAMAGWGAAAGLGAHLMTGLSGPLDGLPAALLGGSVGAVLGAAAAGEGRLRRVGIGLVLVAAGGAAAMLVPGWTGLAILAAAVAIAIHAGASGARWVAGALVGTGALLVAAGAGLQIDAAQELAAWPRALVAAVGGAATSFVAIAALLPRHVGVERDPVDVAAAALPPALDGEVLELVARGRSVWGEVRERLSADPASRYLVRDGVLRLVDVARRSAEVPVDLTASAERVATRIGELDARIAAASDEIAAAQYRQARAAMEDQRRDLDAIRAGRERLVARMHNYLAGLERFRLVVIKHQAASASQLAAEARPLLGEVSDLAAELDAAGEALADVEASSEPATASPLVG
jgi:hypothetical protein